MRSGNGRWYKDSEGRLEDVINGFSEIAGLTIRGVRMKL